MNPISLLETILHALAGFVTDTIDQFGVGAVFVLGTTLEGVFSDTEDCVANPTAAGC